MLLKEYLEKSIKSDLTIISSSYNSAKFLNLNLALTKTLNPDKKIFWIVIQNTPLESRSNDTLDDEFIVIDGPLITDEEKKSIGYGSFQHAKAINIASNYVTTNHYLVLDPDCYILQSNWISRLTDFLDKNEIIFFGTPYHPERLNYFNVFSRTFVDFPCAICLLINKELLQKNFIYSLDFTPNISGKFNLISYQESLRKDLEVIKNNNAIFGILNFIKYLIKNGVSRSWHLLRIGNYSWIYDPRPDIGSLIYENLSKKFKYFCLSTYYPKKIPIAVKILSALKLNIFRGYPNKSGSWSKNPHELINKRLISQGRWEQFFFFGEIFCVHLGKISYAGDSSDYLNMKIFLNKYLSINFELDSLDPIFKD